MGVATAWVPSHQSQLTWVQLVTLQLVVVVVSVWLRSVGASWYENLEMDTGELEKVRKGKERQLKVSSFSYETCLNYERYTEL